MSSSSRLPAVRRSTVAGSLAIAAVLNVGALISPASAEGTAALLGIYLFVFAQAFWAIGLVGIGHLASSRSPVLGPLGAVLAALGTFGHAVYGGVRLLQFSLTDPQAAAAALEVSESAAFVPFLALGLFGTVLGFVLLAVAIIRSRIAPLWIPIALLAWVVAEFTLSNFAAWSTYASVTVGVVVFVALAVAVWQSPIAAWRTEAEAAAALPQPSYAAATA